ncbi:hypothetical protein OJF2_28290 [Aquisphaera giovannonii]|uniref:Uncharacterized protein n=2 Tax=Aquisphaera giovannonii TaxID=406548 RepID=A0A5B9W234_9BACT|nr:hypothetical protein [Aquisphaera giovannonii]QEH34294.1 hypothetical protein OJF2_28290 [Aquisphaera giovannonii]
MRRSPTPRREAAEGRKLAPAAPAEETDEMPPWAFHDERARRAARARVANTRRRAIDPTTCDRDYSAAEVEFMRAMQEYKERSGRMFPTWSEVLEVLQDLGYEKAQLTATDIVGGEPAQGHHPR